MGYEATDRQRLRPATLRTILLRQGDTTDLMKYLLRQGDTTDCELLTGGVLHPVHGGRQLTQTLNLDS